MTKKINALKFDEAAHNTYQVKRYVGGAYDTTEDAIAEEVPIALVYNGVSHAVMLATPIDLEDFALGFSLSEGIIAEASDLYSIESIPQPNGIALQLEIASEQFQLLKEKRRSMTGRTGCGLCGSDSLEHALRLPSAAQLAALNAAPLMRLPYRMVAKATQAIRVQQTLQKETGATHASAYVACDGTVLMVREDVGRHNALDKLIGAVKQQALPAGFILTTSRASYEMVQKTVSAGVSILVAISAPTGLAIRVAEAYGVTLVGFARDDRFVVYCDARQQIEHAE